MFFGFILIAACKYAREKQQQEKQEAINSLPPILRPKTKQSRELAAMAHFQQKIRPRRHIDTFRFSRKKWARKEVAMNPFLYGKKDELSQFRRPTPLIAQPTEPNSDLKETVDGASPVPNSLMDLFTTSPDVEDGGSALTVPSDLEISPRRNELQYQETRGVMASTPVVKKPVKKVWAKKKFADSKIEKGRKRS